MGRNLFKAPIEVLMAQAEDTRIHLVAMDPVRDAFVAAEQDLVGLERELAAAIAAGSAATVAAGHAREAVRRATLRQRAVNTSFAGWCQRVRRRLDQAEGSGDDARMEAAGKVRAHLGRHPGRRFAGTLDSLRKLVPELAAQAECLGAARWRPDLVGEAQRLLASAESAAVQRNTEVRRQQQCGRAVARARTGLRTALSAVRAAWNLAIEDRSELPEMPLGQLEAYADAAAAQRVARRSTRKSESARPTSESTRPTSESARPTSESTRPTSESARPTSESARPTSESARPTSESTRPADGHLDSDPGHLDSDPDHVDSDSGHLDSDPGHLDSDPGHLDSDSGH